MEGFRIQNIKSFQDSGQIEIRPITVFIGRNSSGKSSLIRFPLVLQQSFQNNFSGPLIFDGSSVDYGNFDDVVFNHDMNLPISFSIDLNTDNLIQAIDQLLFKDLTNTGLDLLDYFEKGYPATLTVKAKNMVKDNLRQLYISEFILSIGKEKILKAEFLGENRYLLNGYGFKKTEREMKFNNFFINFDNIIMHFIFSKDLIGEYLRSDMLIVEEIQKNLRRVLSELIYIGPFRTMPLRDYRLKEGEYISVGKDGSAAPYILASKYLQEDKLFFEKINNWLGTNMHVEIDVNLFNGNMFKILVKNLVTGRVSNLLDVGFGISQVLPILIQSYMQKEIEEFNSEPVTKLHIIEQPEIHLHPSAQSSLADLFIEGYQLDKQNRFIIETHSRNMILRLRRRIAERKISPDDVAIYYVKSGVNSDDPSEIERLDINEFGEIPDWPDDFFDQAYQDVIALKAARSQYEQT
ncbi:MAG: DUF3696 domain-containing protein [Halanaerobiales bacterium]|nr:DUF3696 domain-containing protein [Halanaerobiales bacterium]